MRKDTPLPIIFPAEQLPAPQALAEAQRFEAAGLPALAEALYRHLLALQPNFHPAWHALGLLAYAAGQLPIAVRYIAQAIALNDTEGLYHRNLGEMLRRLGQLDESVAANRRAAALLPNDVDAHYNLGLALADDKQYVAAVVSYRRVLSLRPDHGLAWNNLGATLEKQGDLAGAEECYAAAVRINPGHAEAQNNLGAVYSEQGRLDEARACFEAAIVARPDFAEAHFNLSPLKTYRADDPQVAALEALARSSAPMTVDARIRHLFALGKAREDCGAYDASFAAYAEGNRLQYALHPWNDALAQALWEKTRRAFDENFFAERQAHNEVDVTPIFIVGMPRSGTTLIEQILASHPAVFGAGELKDLSEVLEEHSRAAGTPDLPTWAAQASMADFAAVGRAYIERLKKLAPGARIVTDKMPGNFFLIGVIRLALPNAKIIHSVREPMDSSFSCFSRLFNDAMDFTYDLGALGRYCGRYLKMMAHWHRVLPAGTVLDVRYEAMVADTESQVRRLLEHVGLPWNDNCLAFHKNKRRVKTASVAQVRQPIYTSSVARWQRFEKHLQPLRDALASIGT